MLIYLLNFHMKDRRLLTVKQAAEILNVSGSHIYELIYEADRSNQSTWKHGREIITLSTKSALRRTLRINISAVLG